MDLSPISMIRNTLPSILRWRHAHHFPKFAEHDEESLEKLAKLWGDDNSYGVAVRQRLEDLQRVLADDQEELNKEATTSPST